MNAYVFTRYQIPDHRTVRVLEVREVDIRLPAESGRFVETRCPICGYTIASYPCSTDCTARTPK
jgi:hypothetical protein